MTNDKSLHKVFGGRHDLKPSESARSFVVTFAWFSSLSYLVSSFQIDNAGYIY